MYKKYLLSIILTIILSVVPTTLTAQSALPKQENIIQVVTITDYRISRLIIYIDYNYNVSRELSEKIVKIAFKYGNKTQFPTAIDILTIIAIESAFDVRAESRKTKARGLMQILYKKSSFDIHKNIEDGVWLLNDYADRLSKPEAAIHAYNVGIGNYRKGIRNQKYVKKFKKIKKILENI